MSLQHQIEDFQKELTTFPLSEDLPAQDLEQQARRLESFIDKVDAVVRQEVRAVNDGETDDALAAIGEARERVRAALDGLCREGHDHQGMCVMCFNMAQASVADALEDLWAVAKAEKVGS
ncbi:MAG TPA: hypothetical protein VFB58_00395 [Chloroflexota bacterium]|nr:hypothetical protein [Chloroflexota bacterium]